MPRTQKVVAYVLREDNHLLVMRHPHHPEAGLQVPAGTVEPGESPDLAVLREVKEETGLDAEFTVNQIGTQRFDMAPFRDEVHQRTFYQLRVPPNHAVPASWRQMESGAARGTPDVEFQWDWIPFGGGDPGLAIGQGSFLHRVTEATRNPVTRPPMTESYGLDRAINEWRVADVARAADALATLFEMDVPSKIAPTPRNRALIHQALRLAMTAAPTKDVRLANLARELFEHVVGGGRAQDGLLIIAPEDCEALQGHEFESPLLVTRGAAPLTIESPEAGLIREGLNLALAVGFGDILRDSLGAVLLTGRKPLIEPHNSYTLSALPSTVFTDWTPSLERMAETLVHESAHNWLNDALRAFQIDLDPAQTWWSPWRRVERPARGILQAIFAFSHVIQFLGAVAADEVTGPVGRAYCVQRAAAELQSLREGIPTFREAIRTVNDPRLAAYLSDEFSRALSIGSAVVAS